MEHTPQPDTQPEAKTVTDKQIKRRNFLAFTTFFVASGAAYGGWKWLYNSPMETPGITANVHKPLRRALNQTELFFRNFFSNNHLVKTYPKAKVAKNVRVNSDIGIEDKNYNMAAWQLQVVKSPMEVLKISMDEIKALPKTEIVYSFKCVEGWDQIQHWAGVKMEDFINHFGLQEQAKRPYIGMETPNKKYYVGLDRESALHPQTLLAYEMNDQPITEVHGAPLRLIIPVKYGIKNLKRIGTITFSNTRPRDYWAEQGYDYYSGL
jgi:DMSO/TMAO reductase YedYZ molybdopterin-dependent catalytic subunit